MPNTSKSSKKTSPAAGTAAATEFVDALSPLYLSSVQRVADLQKTCLDAAAQQTTELLSAWQNAFSAFPVAPPALFFGAVGQAVQTLVDTQKSAIDLVVEQTQAVTEINKTRAAAYSKIVDQVTGTVQATITRSVEAQKKALEFASAQNKIVCEATKKQIGRSPATTMVDAYERGANTVIEVQKSFLDIATKPFVAAN